jgi:transposase
LSIEVVLESLLFVLCEGCSWRAIDRPQARWNSVYQYFRRWSRNGTLKEALIQCGPYLKEGWHFLDSTHVKVHADGSNPAGGQASQAMGRTKGGLNTKIHVVVNAKAQPITIALSAGNEADISVAPELTLCIPSTSTLIADKAYDSFEFRQAATARKVKTCIPPRSNRKIPVAFSPRLYKRRHRIENFCQKIKQFRRVATRYDKLAETYFGFVCLAIILVAYRS